MQKTCTLCGETKDVSEFYKKRNSYENICKKCKYEKNKKNHKLICKECGKEFYSSKKEQQFCSKKCRGKHQKNKTIVKCEVCGKEIRLTKYQIKRSEHHYCSNECRAIGVGIYQSGKNNPNYKNATIKVKCSNCGKDIKILNCNLKNSDGSLKNNFYCSQSCKAKHQSILLLGKNNTKWSGGNVQYKCDNCGKEISVKRYKFKTGQKYFYCSSDCKSEHQKITLLGKNNPNYIDGLSQDYRERYRIIDGYNIWRRKVYERDDFTCQKCGDDKGGNLNAHHLNGYSWDIENRTNVNNGITLCEHCHKEFHMQYGYGNNTKEQYQNFIKNKKIKSA